MACKYLLSVSLILFVIALNDVSEIFTLFSIDCLLLKAPDTICLTYFLASIDFSCWRAAYVCLLHASADASTAAAHWHIARSQGGHTALIHTAADGHANCVQLLLDAGADKETKDWVRMSSGLACGLGCAAMIRVEGDAPFSVSRSLYVYSEYSPCFQWQSNRIAATKRLKHHAGVWVFVWTLWLLEMLTTIGNFNK